MAELLSYLIPALAGDDEGQNPLILSSALSPDGCSNLWIDKLGQVRPIDGFSVIDSGILTDTGGSATRVRNLYFYRKIAAGATTRQLIICLDDGTNEFEVWYSTDLGATQTLIADLGAGSVGSIGDFSTFGDTLFFTNGVVAPKTWDGTTWADAGGTQLGAPSAASGGAGNLKGNYDWKLVPILANKDHKIASVASTTIQLDDEEADLTWTADADTNVLGYELYRTSGTGLDFYFVTYINGRTTAAYTDNLPDSQLIRNAVLSVSRSHGDAPPSGAYFNEPHKGRLWYGRTDTYPRRIWWSDPGDPDSVYQDRSYTELTDAESLGDQLTGMTGDFEGMMVGWLRETIWTISGTGQLSGGVFDWRKRRSNARTGTVSHRTVGRVNAGAVYTDALGRRQTTNRNMLAFLSSQKDIRLFDGDNDIIISFPKQTTLARLNLVHAHKAIVYHDEAHGMFTWVFPYDAQTENSLAVSWDYIHGAWFHSAPGGNRGRFGDVVVAESTTESGVLIAGDSFLAGTLWRLWDGDDKAGSSNISEFATNAIYLPAVQDGPPDLQYEKRVHAVVLLFAKDLDNATNPISVLAFQHDAEIDLNTYPEVPDIISKEIDPSGRQRVLLQENSFLLSVFGVTPNEGRFFHGVGIRIGWQYVRNNGVAAYVLRGIEFQYQVLRGRKR